MTDGSRSLLGLLFAVVCAWLSAGCATRYDRVTLGNIEVHTFTRGHANVHVLVEDGRSLAVDSGLARNAPELDADLRAAGVVGVPVGEHDGAELPRVEPGVWPGTGTTRACTPVSSKSEAG